jgi:hypothetical protein
MDRQQLAQLRQSISFQTSVSNSAAIVSNLRGGFFEILERNNRIPLFRIAAMRLNDRRLKDNFSPTIKYVSKMKSANLVL